MVRNSGLILSPFFFYFLFNQPCWLVPSVASSSTLQERSQLSVPVWLLLPPLLFLPLAPYLTL